MLLGVIADDFTGAGERDVRRLVVARGETSDAVVQALGLEAMAIGPEIDPGVPILADPQRGVALALKSGNFGAPDFFDKAEGRAPRGVAS